MKRALKLLKAISKIEQVSLQLEFFVVSHGLLIFTIKSDNTVDAVICFSGASFINCPIKISSASIITNNKEKNDIIRDYFPNDIAKFFEKTNLYSIDCREGKFFILADRMDYLKNEEAKEIKSYINTILKQPIGNTEITIDLLP